MALRPLVAGNWKMHGVAASLGEIAGLLDLLWNEPLPDADIIICPPATLLDRAREVVTGSIVKLGGQDCHPKSTGANTGDISAEMLADAGAEAVIVGHSERRADHGESDALIAAKAEAAYRAKLIAIICVGETGAERRSGETLAVVGGQIEGSVPSSATAANTVIAYEPVWAIGTGLTPTPADIAAVHGFIRERLTKQLGPAAEAVRILYGGSVKPGNAAELLTIANVNGALVGGASLKATDFYAILSAYRETHR
jgi:triosephosphate isomerase (TIM)